DVVQVGRHVVVVPFEASARDAVRGGERVQLVQRGAGAEMGPETAVRRPGRWVDQDRHAGQALPASATSAPLWLSVALLSSSRQERTKPASTYDLVHDEPGRTAAPRCTRVTPARTNQGTCSARMPSAAIARAAKS